MAARGAIFPARQHSQPQNLPGPQGLAPLGLRHTLAVPAEPEAAQTGARPKRQPQGWSHAVGERPARLTPASHSNHHHPAANPATGPGPVPSHWRKPGPMLLADDNECARVRVSCCTSVLYSPTRRLRPAASRTACPSTSSLRRSRDLSPEKRCWCRCATSLCRPGGLRPPVNRRTSCSVDSLI